MFKKLLDKIYVTKLAPIRKDALTPKELKEKAIFAGIMQVIEEKRKTDPLIGPKIGGKEIAQQLITAMKTKNGVHIESILCAIGSLAGYSCQVNVRTQSIEKGMQEDTAFVIVKTDDGKHYFFGDQLNESLVESKYSVWSLAAGAAQEAGCQNLPDVEDIFRHVSKVIGTKEFGVLRIPEVHRPGHASIDYLKAFWPTLFSVAKQFCQHPSEWPILFGLAAQNIILQGKEVIDPSIALTIVMESAIPMSKIDLANSE